MTALRLALACMILWFMCPLACSAKGWRTQGQAENLALTPEEQSEADALALYGWAVCQRKSPFLGNSPYGYLAALRADPASEFLLQEVVGSIRNWATERQNGFLIRELLGLSRAHPEAVGLRLVISNAYLHESRPDKAWELLSELATPRRLNDARVFRQVLHCLRALDNLREARRLIGRGNRIPEVQGTFLFQQGSALHFHALSQMAGHTQSRRDSNTERAREAALQAVSLCGQIANYANAMALTTVLLAHREVEGALHVVQMLERLEMDQPGSRQLEAECFSALGRRKDSLAVWERLGVSFPFHGEYHLRVGELSEQLGSLHEAVRAFELVYRLEPSLALALRIAALHHGLQNYEEAAKFAALAPRDVLASYRIEAHALDRLGQPAKGAKVLQQAAIYARRHHLAAFLNLPYFMKLAQLRLRAEASLDTVISPLESALALNANHAAAANFLGFILADHNLDLPRAEQLIRQAVGAEPYNSAYLDSLAWLYFRKGAIGQASEAIERVMQEPVGDYLIYKHAWQIYLAADDRERASKYRALAIQTAADAGIEDHDLQPKTKEITIE